jgi:anti-sigma B factor antagonist
MEIHTSNEGNVAVVHCGGRLTMVDAPELKEAIFRTVEGGASRVVIDLGQTTFVDSSGLGALVAGLKKSRQAGGDLRISSPGPQVRMVLSLTNLDRVLRPYESMTDATDGW